VVRGEELGRTMSAYLVTRIEEHPLIDVRLRTQVTGLAESGGALSAVTVHDAGGRTEELPARALFLCIGGQPCTAWADHDGVRTDRAGYVMTGPDLLDRGRRPDDWPLDRDPLTLETSIPGFFAAGDVRHGSIKRVASGVGEGSMAIAFVHQYLAEVAKGASPSSAQ
jgi:thioredoxin reductase (NADPH)